jgi:hypothetical protein
MKEPLPDGDTIEYIVDTTKNWRTINEDVLFLSKVHKFNNILFTLWGNRERTEDLWKRYYINEKMQACVVVITYPKYDENNFV